jgi:triacylglycerol esterase/lipase EstA (alpha/beta hydrolase family)
VERAVGDEDGRTRRLTSLFWMRWRPGNEVWRVEHLSLLDLLRFYPSGRNLSTMGSRARSMRGHAVFLAGAAALMLLGGCETPGVRERSKPRMDSPVAAAVLHPRRLSESTRDYLAREGFGERYGRDSALTIEELGRHLESVPSREGRVALGELCVKMAERVGAVEPSLALAYYLRCAELTYEDVVAPEGDADLEEERILYNRCCTRAAVILFESGYSWAETVAVKGSSRTYILESRVEDFGLIDPRRFDRLIPASMLDVNGMDERHVQEGLGGVLVGYRRSTPERVEADPLLSPLGMAIPLTATIHFSADGEVAEIAIHDVLVKDEIRIRGRDRNLAADFTLPLALLLDGAPRKTIGFEGMVHPGKYVDSAGVFRVEPYRPRQVPVVFVHGLMASPQVWVTALNEFRADPVLRENYQPYVAYYPTGFPIPYNAAMLRARLEGYRDQVRALGRSSSMKPMVFIGHSMGGILSNLQTRDSGEKVRELYFDVPLEETTLNPEAQATLRNLLYFKGNPDIDRVVFMAAPHRGSKIADSPLGQLGSLFIKIPLEIVSLNFLRPDPAVEPEGLTAEAREFMQQPPDGVYSLRQDNLFLQTILELPAHEGVNYHSIIGVKGGGDPENGSDGVVPYSSAYLEEAASSKVVNSGHTSITSNAEAIEEVRRILYLHLGRPYEGPREGAGAR